MKASALEHVIFRPSFIFGRDGGILPTFMKLAKLAPVTGVVGSGKQRIQPIWIDDLAAYFAASVDKLQAAGRDVRARWALTSSTGTSSGGASVAHRTGRRLATYPPTGLMKIPATLTERLPGRPTAWRDLLTMLETGDNVV